MDFRKNFVVEHHAKFKLGNIDPSYKGTHESHEGAAVELDHGTSRNGPALAGQLERGGDLGRVARQARELLGPAGHVLRAVGRLLGHLRHLAHGRDHLV